jgi:hypothetical protein
MTKQELWLDDNPDQTLADFARYSGSKATDRERMHFEAWEELQRLIADGFVIRVAGGNYMRTDKPISPSMMAARRGALEHWRDRKIPRVAEL